ncbi:MAG TPA: hypothetical protein VLA93_06890 [Pyrinomonadaceae bacterium]|nr:hypothetical protein [Pyrinomonadaceae bacterium]
MFCPQCGQQQVSGIVRFCSRCGFPLDGVIQLLSSGGLLPVYQNPDEPVKISPRRRGVKQGGMLLLMGAVLVPIFGVMTSFSNSTFLEILTAFAAIICFLGGPLRMLYAAVFEEGAPNPFRPPPRPYVPAQVPPHQFNPHVQQSALPPQSVQPPAWRPRPITAELTAPPSVTENTTRLLDRDERKE